MIHSKQAFLEVAPCAVEYLPAAQFSHVSALLLPILDAYLPLSHLEQSSMSSFPSVTKYVPGPHGRHVFADEAPVELEYVPATQFTQAVSSPLPSVSRYVPAMQFKHDELAYPAYFPRMQDRQSPIDAAPGVAEYVPLSQTEHTDFPTVLLYRPGTQAVHGPLASSPGYVTCTSPVYPLLHLQSVIALLAEPDVLLNSGQLLHFALDVLLLYLPVIQPTQISPSSPVYPGLHLQSVIALLAESDVVLNAGQLVHQALDVLLLYLPMVQREQCPPSEPVWPALHWQAVF